MVQLVDWADIPAAFHAEIFANYVVIQSADGLLEMGETEV